MRVRGYAGSMTGTGARSGDGQRTERSSAVCDRSLAKAFGFLGKRWNGLLLAALIPGPLGYADLRRAVGTISDSVLAERLAGLTRAGLVLRRVEPGPPLSVEYRLTPAGQALLPAMDELAAWAAENLPDDGPCTGGHLGPADPRVDPLDRPGGCAGD